MDFGKINFGSFLPSMPYQVRELLDKATNIVMNYTETEAKVVEATNDESWGPSGKLLQELSQLSHSYENYNEVRDRTEYRSTEFGMVDFSSWECFGNDALAKRNGTGDEPIK